MFGLTSCYVPSEKPSQISWLAIRARIVKHEVSLQWRWCERAWSVEADKEEICPDSRLSIHTHSREVRRFKFGWSSTADAVLHEALWGLLPPYSSTLESSMTTDVRTGFERGLQNGKSRGRVDGDVVCGSKARDTSSKRVQWILRWKVSLNLGSCRGSESPNSCRYPLRNASICEHLAIHPAFSEQRTANAPTRS